MMPFGFSHFLRGITSINVFKYHFILITRRYFCIGVVGPRPLLKFHLSSFSSIFIFHVLLKKTPNFGFIVFVKCTLHAF